MKFLALTVVCGLAALPAFAQPRAAARPLPLATTPTVTGDTGLWFVPTAEVLPAGRWSLSAYRENYDYDQGFTDASNWPLALGAGVNGRAEMFAALTMVNRIDRDVRPLFFPTVEGFGAGVVNEYPFVTEGWTGTNLGDLWIGAKFNLTSQYRQSPAAMAVRAMVKIPTADKDAGAGTGQADVALDAIVSGEVNGRVELSGFGGFVIRRDPDEYDLLNGFRWGFGAGLPTRKTIRLTAELHGEAYTGGTVTTSQTGFGPGDSAQKSPATATIGLTWLGGNGLFAGVGMSWNLRMKARSDFGPYEDKTGDAIGLQVRIGYQPKRK